MLGVVVSDADSPNTSYFTFVLNKPAPKGAYVAIENNNNYMIGSIVEVYGFNEYLSRKELYEEVEHITSQLPVNAKSITFARVRILGSFKDGKFFQNSFSPIPGDKVKSVDQTIMKKFFGIVDNGLFLGSARYLNLDVKIDLERLFGKHLSILAMSGAGKSNLVAVLFEELIKRKGVIPIIFDIHGEYKPFEKLYDSVLVVEGSKVKFPYKFLRESIFYDLFPDLTEQQAEILFTNYRKYVKKLKKDPSAFSLLKFFKEYIQQDPNAKNNTVFAIKRKLKRLSKMKLIGYAYPDFRTILKQNEGIIFDLSDIEKPHIRNIKIYYILKRLFYLRKKNLIPPVILFLEEAHNICPEHLQKAESLAKKEVERISREGRKYGLSLVVISQRPAHLSQTVLSQCSSQIFLRITNPNDLAYVSKISEYIDDSILTSLPSLEPGVGVITGAAVNSYLFVKFRRRAKELDAFKNKGLSKMIEEWNNKKEKNYFLFK